MGIENSHFKEFYANHKYIEGIVKINFYIKNIVDYLVLLKKNKEGASEEFNYSM